MEVTSRRYVIVLLLAVSGCTPPPQPDYAAHARSVELGYQMRLGSGGMSPELQRTLDDLDYTIAQSRYERAVYQLDMERRMNGWQ